MVLLMVLLMVVMLMVQPRSVRFCGVVRCLPPPEMPQYSLNKDIKN